MGSHFLDPLGVWVGAGGIYPADPGCGDPGGIRELPSLPRPRTACASELFSNCKGCRKA